MEDDEERGEGSAGEGSARVETATMEVEEETCFPVLVTSETTDEANREWSIPVTPVTEVSRMEEASDDDEENWEYEIGQKPRKREKENEEDGLPEIRNSEEEEEDLEDRYEFEIEASVADFQDEEFIGRKTIPESSDEEEDELDVRYRRSKKSNDKLEVGTAFLSGYEFKEAVLHYALSKGRNIEQSRWNKTKLSFKCANGGKCKWKVYCGYDQPKQKWLVKTRYKYHSCTPNGKCKLLRSPVIARLFLDKLREDNKLMSAKIQELIKEKWKLIASRNQCQRGRTVALQWLDKEYADQFAHLRGYVREIEKTNQGTTVVLETIPNAAKEDVFDRFYVCFEKLRSSWSGTCRPIIGLDGTFLKVATKGILLTAVGHDGNNQIYPIAWAVVQGENSDTWLWFIKRLKHDLNLGDGRKFVLLSDSSKVKKIFFKLTDFLFKAYCFKLTDFFE